MKIYSQHSEQQIIKSIFDVNGPQNKWCVEVGAQDGKTDSNTYALVKQGWRSLQIEANPAFYGQLEKRYKDHPKVKISSKKIGRGFFNDGNNLNVILNEHQVPRNFDFFSLDIDSYEYEVWQNLSEFEPNLVCVEFNAKELDETVIDYDPSYTVNPQPGYGGVTLGLLDRLAKEKSYERVAVEVNNVFYIRKAFRG